MASDTGSPSGSQFRVLHALRIKGFAKVEVLADLCALDPHEVDEVLGQLRSQDLALFRETRQLWQLTAKGREVHAAELEAESAPVRVLVEPYYPGFLDLNDSFKELCGDWQLRDGTPNDHSDVRHDEAVIRRLLDMDALAQPVVTAIGTGVPRMASYGPRLAATARRVAEGDHHLFTGVMCGSYHDVWMELHEDLILTLGIDRTMEGSY